MEKEKSKDFVRTIDTGKRVFFWIKYLIEKVEMLKKVDNWSGKSFYKKGKQVEQIENHHLGSFGRSLSSHTRVTPRKLTISQGSTWVGKDRTPWSYRT